MIKSIISLLVLSVSLVAVAQVNTSHPDTYFGFGQRATTSDPVHHALGNTLLAYTDSTLLNYHDPSSYHRITEGYPLFSIQLHDQYSIYNDGQNTMSTNRMGIQQFALAIPFAKRFGLGFGLRPMYQRNYEFRDTHVDGEDSTYYDYSGQGSLSRAYAGFSWGIIKKSNFIWSVGAQSGLVFGTLANRRTSSTNSSDAGGLETTNMRVRGLNYDFSTSLFYQLSEKQEIGAVAAMKMPLNLGVESVEHLRYVTDVNNPNPAFFQSVYVDTAQYVAQGQQQLSYGLNYGVSFVRTTRKNKTLHSKINVLASYTETDYSNFTLGNNDKPYGSDYSQWGIGVQYRPETKQLGASAKVSLLTRITYRVGYYQSQLPIAGSMLNSSQFGTTFGLGIPLTRQRAVSSLNLGFEIGQREDVFTSSTLKQQNYGLTFGLTVSPSAADRWFRKRKLD